MRALWLIQRTYRRYFYTTWKGNLSSQMWFFVQLYSSWQDFNWLKGSCGLSAAAELLVIYATVFLYNALNTALLGWLAFVIICRWLYVQCLRTASEDWQLNVQHALVTLPCHSFLFSFSPVSTNSLLQFTVTSYTATPSPPVRAFSDLSFFSFT